MVSLRTLLDCRGLRRGIGATLVAVRTVRKGDLDDHSPRADLYCSTARRRISSALAPSANDARHCSTADSIGACRSAQTRWISVASDTGYGAWFAYQ